MEFQHRGEVCVDISIPIENEDGPLLRPVKSEPNPATSAQWRLLNCIINGYAPIQTSKLLDDYVAQMADGENDAAATGSNELVKQYFEKRPTPNQPMDLGI